MINTMKRKFTTVLLIALAVIILAVVIIDAVRRKSDPQTAAFTAMGSPFSVTVYDKDGADFDAVRNVVDALDNEISRHIAGSKIAALNENKCVGGLSADALGCIKASLDICRDSGGALDITIGDLSALWDFDSGRGVPPAKDEIGAALPGVDFSLVSINDDEISTGASQSLDLGAVGKGAACDVIKRELERQGVQTAIASAGGTVMTFGDKSGGAWSVGIKTPEKDNAAGRYFAKLALRGVNFVSTSGSYEKFFEYGGRLYHHILDPATGYPADSGLISVTVIAGSGTAADALSTACFVLGYDRSLDLLEKYGAKAVFVTADKTVLTTGGADDVLEITDDDYR